MDPVQPPVTIFDKNESVNVRAFPHATALKLMLSVGTPITYFTQLGDKFHKVRYTASDVCISDHTAAGLLRDISSQASGTGDSGNN